MQPSPSSISCAVRSAYAPSPLVHHLPLTMQSLVAARTNVFRKSARGFASSAARAQAAPVEKPTLNKEFKIYRWVCRNRRSRPPYTTLGAKRACVLLEPG